jgi:hypothetical protein
MILYERVLMPDIDDLLKASFPLIVIAERGQISIWLPERLSLNF